MDDYSLDLLERLSLFLNRHTTWISRDTVQELVRDTSVTEEEACLLLLASALEIDPFGSEKDRILFHMLSSGFKLLDPAPFLSDTYCSLPFPQEELDGWAFSWGSLEPFEMFVRDDFALFEGRIIPRIGCFPVSYRFPRVLQNGREWMSVTPNEAATMDKALHQTHGKVLTFGLGMGYYLFHALEKPDVLSVTVVERDRKLLDLFHEALFPYFQKDKDVQFVVSDAFDYAETEMGCWRFDTVFTDLWHDAGDGIPLYLKMKALEHHSPDSCFLYWIEDTMKAYLEE